MKNTTARPSRTLDTIATAINNTIAATRLAGLALVPLLLSLGSPPSAAAAPHPFAGAHAALFRQLQAQPLQPGQTLPPFAPARITQFVTGQITTPAAYIALRREFQRYARHFVGGDALKTLEQTGAFSLLLFRKRLLVTQRDQLAALRRVRQTLNGTSAQTRALTPLLRATKDRTVVEALRFTLGVLNYRMLLTDIRTYAQGNGENQRLARQIALRRREIRAEIRWQRLFSAETKRLRAVLAAAKGR